jgi:nitrate reductase NapAB chaperone NapD
MPVCSYLVVPERGRSAEVARRLSALSGCDVAPARNRDVLLLVTATPSPREDRELRAILEGMSGIHALVLTFGEIDPDTPEADPLAAGRSRRGRRLPVVDPGGWREDTPPGASHSPPQPPSDP